PEVYLLAADSIGVPSVQCLVFEDAVVGVQAARRAGMRVIGVATAHPEDELRAAGAASVIDDFEGLHWPAWAPPSSGPISTPAAEFEQRDIFTLGRDYANAFDGVWEYTCFCAIDPARRAEYVRTMAVIVRPGGWLLACFYPIRRGGGGPPFPMARSEVRRLFA